MIPRYEVQIIVLRDDVASNLIEFDRIERLKC